MTDTNRKKRFLYAFIFFVLFGSVITLLWLILNRKTEKSANIDSEQAINQSHVNKTEPNKNVDAKNQNFFKKSINTYLLEFA